VSGPGRSRTHTGECDIADGKVGGVAAEIGLQVANQAAAGEALVSSTVKDLVAGSVLQFEDKGLLQLAGMSGEWRLFRARVGREQ
jgi:class 3 adenylate cyclase